eukprot:TRINITY_DN312_c0_g1_i1.p1 TRINITY_DN312_c0_g1~~TRINITY_DN312_c0_g1_i1.p1  ORF type:complete len:256 (-),score=61.26 TRINITY_DN312_c0_g1_i1:175-942(-)
MAQEYVSLTKLQPQLDPYFVVKEKVQEAIQKLSEEFEAWRSLLDATNTQKDQKFATLTTTIQNNITDIEADVADLDEVVLAISSDRERFKAIPDSEVATRSKFVVDIKKALNNFKDTMNSARTNAKVDRDRRQQLLGDGPSASTSRDEKSSDSEIIQDAKQKQKDLVDQQGEILDDMNQAMGRLITLSQDMTTELASQNDDLTSMVGDVDSARGTMDVVLKKLDKILHTSRGGRWCCIFLLAATAIALTIAIFQS